MNVAMVSSWHVHAEGYARELAGMEDVKVSAVWDDDPAAGMEWANQIGCRFYDDYDELLADKKIDGIVCTAPTSQHTDLLVRAARAGKHIFCEKVLALTVEDCDAIAQAVEQAGVVFTICFPHACRPEVQFAHDMVTSGQLGQITYARVRNPHNGSIAGWLPAHFYDPATCGGGAMIDLGAHPMYLLQWLMGTPQRVTSTFTQVTGKAVEDNAVSVFTYENGAIGVSETAFVAECSPFVLELCGTAGALTIIDNKVTYANKQTNKKWQTPAKLPAALPSPLRQWVDAVTTGSPVLFDLKWARELTLLMQKAYQAAQTGCQVSF